MLSKELARLQERIRGQIEKRFTGRKNRSARAAQHFYWSVSMPFFRILGEDSLRITMAPGDLASVEVEDIPSGIRLRILRDDGTGSAFTLQRDDGNGWKSLGRYRDQMCAIYDAVRQTVTARLDTGTRDDNAGTRGQVTDVVVAERTPRLFRFGSQWRTAMHRSGWGFALDALQGLHDDRGVLFDGFVEATFCWQDTGRVYKKPWVGVVHNPPQTPEWYSGGRACNDFLLDCHRWHESKDACQGLFVLSEYHRQALQDRVDVPVSVLTHPTEFASNTFCPERFDRNPSPKLVQIGSWLRNPNTLYKLNSPWLAKARLDVGQPWEDDVRRHLPSEALDLDSVEVISRLNDEAYDRLLCENVVFLDLIDASANNAVIECIVRNTPLLVNDHPAVREYLGAQYPMYFRDLQEAERKSADRELILRTHRYLRDLPKERFTEQAFVDQVIRSEVYQRLTPSEVESFVLLAHARTGSTSLMKALGEHPQIRMIHEPFHPTRGDWGYPYCEEVDDEESLDRTLDELYFFHTGIKHLVCQLPQASNEQILRRAKRTILLTRRNLLQAVVSELIAQQTRVWHGPSGKISHLKLKPLELDEVSARLVAERDRVAEHRRVAIDSGRPLLELSFEDLFAPSVGMEKRLETYGRVLQFLGADQADEQTCRQVREIFDPRNSKLTTEAVYDRLPNAELIDRRLGSPQTGFLFDQGLNHDRRSA